MRLWTADLVSPTKLVSSHNHIDQLSLASSGKDPS